MRSHKRGKDISHTVEILNISPHGIWILVGGRELFMDREEFPWFSEATVGQIANVELCAKEYLRWPDLDVDLAIDSIVHPEKYPLKWRR